VSSTNLSSDRERERQQERASERESVRERKRERETDRQTYRQTEIERERERERETDRQRERGGDRFENFSLAEALEEEVERRSRLPCERQIVLFNCLDLYHKSLDSGERQYKSRT